MPWREVKTPWYWIKQIMRYKSYEAKVDFDDTDKVFCGVVEHISDRVVFFAKSADEIEPAFHKAIEEYLERCKVAGVEPCSPVGKIIAFTQLPAVIDKIQGRIQHIPKGPEFLPILETIHLMLEVINAYAFWVEGMKKELVKLDQLNKSQAEALRARGIITQ